MSNQEEIIEVAGKKVVVRYTDDGLPCMKCAFRKSSDLCQRVIDKCGELDKDRVGDEWAYFVDAEQPQEPDYKKLYEDIVNSEWYKKYYHGKSVGDAVVVEQPQADLEAEVKKWVYDPFYDLNGVAIKGATAYITVEDVATIARHFAEWGAEHLQK